MVGSLSFYLLSKSCRSNPQPTPQCCPYAL
jgi:hypothetical protein